MPNSMKTGMVKSKCLFFSIQGKTAIAEDRDIKNSEMVLQVYKALNMDFSR